MAHDLTPTDFAALYDATARDVFAYVRRRTSGDAEDLVAEVYAVAWRRRADLPPPPLRRAWLFGVARNLLKADARRRHREEALVHELAPAPGADPGAARDDTARVVAAAVERLGPTEREVLRLTAWEGLTPVEVAVVLGVRPGTARVRLHRARRALAADPDVVALVGAPVPLRTPAAG